jgi:Flp pilus assembly protein TadB
MIVEFVVVVLAIICVAGYAVYWRRERARWARIHKEEIRTLGRLKKEFERGGRGRPRHLLAREAGEVGEEIKRLKRPKEKIKEGR